MQLTQFTDYSLRVLIYIALKNGETPTITEIAQRYNISKNHLMKVVHRLSQLKILKTIRGKGGGLQLHVLPEYLNLGELIQMLEPNFHIVECFNQENGHCIISPVCRLKGILSEATKNFITTLEKYTLEDLLQNQKKIYQIFEYQNN